VRQYFAAGHRVKSRTSSEAQLPLIKRIVSSIRHRVIWASTICYKTLRLQCMGRVVKSIMGSRPTPLTTTSHKGRSEWSTRRTGQENQNGFRWAFSSFLDSQVETSCCLAPEPGVVYDNDPRYPLPGCFLFGLGSQPGIVNLSCGG